jgi:hypothetical protein
MDAELLKGAPEEDEAVQLAAGSSARPRCCWSHARRWRCCSRECVLLECGPEPAMDAGGGAGAARVTGADEGTQGHRRGDRCAARCKRPAGGADEDAEAAAGELVEFERRSQPAV